MVSDQAQGWLFEQLEVVKFNINAFKNDSSLKAATTDTLGITNHTSVDIVIKNGKKTIKEYQAKSGNKSANTAFMLAEKKYENVNLVGPSDQYEKVNNLYDQRIERNTLKASDYKSAKIRLDKEINSDGIGSGGTTYQESISATDINVATKIAEKFDNQAIAIEMHNSGLEAGKIGATISAGISTFSSLIDLSQGKITTEDMLINLTVDTAKGYMTSYLTTALSKGIPHALIKTGISGSVTKAFTKSNAHLAIAAGIIQSGKSLASYINGDIDRDQLLNDVSHTAVTGASAFYYGALGQLVIPVPILGAFIGSTVGYFIGNMLHQSGLIGLGETAVVEASRKRREQVQAICLEAIPLMQENRLQLELLLEKHFTDTSKTFSNAFDGIEKALISWSPDEFTCELEKINNTFGISLPFKTFDEFDEFMQSDADFIL